MQSSDERLRVRLGAALAEVGVAWEEVTECRRLDGGSFNTVFRVRSADAAGLVVKLAPDSDVPVLHYEQGILATEARFYRAAREAT
ncbi:hypothetical protein ACFQ07_26110, partial [Actinomadura adrarensis]